MKIELPEQFDAVLKYQAFLRGTSPSKYVCDVLERDLAFSVAVQTSDTPFKTGRGMFAKYGPAPSAPEIDANRAEMFANFGERE